MDNVDLITMLSNLGRSLVSVDILISGVSYLVGATMLISGILRFRNVASSGGKGEERFQNALAILVIGALLIYLPSSIHVFSYSLFGSMNILSYSKYSQWTLFDSISILLKTAGLIWFIRGCIMLVHASEPGEEHGIRGLVFITFGIFAMNFTETMSTLAYLISLLASSSFTFKY